MWPDLVKLDHFRQKKPVFGNFSEASLRFSQWFVPTLAKNAIGQIFIVVNGQMMKNNLPNLVTLPGSPAYTEINLKYVKKKF